MNLKNYPELGDFIKDTFFENKDTFKTLYEFIELLEEIGNEPGLNHQDLLGLITELRIKCEQMESGEDDSVNIEELNHYISNLETIIFNK